MLCAVLWVFMKMKFLDARDKRTSGSFGESKKVDHATRLTTIDVSAFMHAKLWRNRKGNKRLSQTVSKAKTSMSVVEKMTHRYELFLVLVAISHCHLRGTVRVDNHIARIPRGTERHLTAEQESIYRDSVLVLRFHSTIVPPSRQGSIAPSPFP